MYRQLWCSHYEQGCGTTASMLLEPEHAPINVYWEHNYQPPSYDIENSEFYHVLRQQASIEGTTGRTIFAEEARK